jgi:hypothetical protein
MSRDNGSDSPSNESRPATRRTLTAPLVGLGIAAAATLTTLWLPHRPVRVVLTLLNVGILLIVFAMVMRARR